MKISLTYLGTRNSKFRLNLTQRVTGSLVSYKLLFRSTRIYIFLLGSILESFFLHIFSVWGL